MLSRPEFIRQSLELHLFFARNMKEHMLLKSPNNSEQAQGLDDLGIKLEKLLSETISLSKRTISHEAVASGEFITPYTLEAESSAGISSGTSLTQSEYLISGEMNIIGNSLLEDKVRTLNSEAISMICSIIESGTEKTEIISDNMKSIEQNEYKFNENIIIEANFYLRALQRLQDCEEAYAPSDRENIQIIWNSIMVAHTIFMREALSDTSEYMAEQFCRFEGRFAELAGDMQKTADCTMPQLIVLKKNIQTCEEFRDLLSKLTQELSRCKDRPSVLPLIADHMLREVCFYLRLLI